MKKINFVIFFSIALSVYALINYYIFVREWEAGGFQSTWRTVYVAAFLLLSLSFIAGRMLERVTLSWLSSTLVLLGSFWLAAMVYFLLFAFAIDIIPAFEFHRSIFSVIPYYRSRANKGNNLVCRHRSGHVHCIGGYINARTPRIKTLVLTIPKNGRGMKSLNIAVASDIHLGRSFASQSSNE